MLENKLNVVCYFKTLFIYVNDAIKSKCIINLKSKTNLFILLQSQLRYV